MNDNQALTPVNEATSVLVFDRRCTSAHPAGVCNLGIVCSPLKIEIKNWGFPEIVKKTLKPKLEGYKKSEFGL